MIDNEIIKANNIFIRYGECSRCGKCCYIFHRRNTEEGRIPCEHLEFDEKGLAVCKLGDNRPQLCKDFPLYPFRDLDKEFFKDCTYYWELNKSLSKEEALKKFNFICAHICALGAKDTCIERQGTIARIEQELVGGS